MRWYLPVLLLMVSPLAQAQERQWRDPDPENLLYIETDDGRAIVELAPRFAPKTVANIIRLSRKGAYDRQTFYRVIENFVVQGGTEAGDDIKVPMEADFDGAGLVFTSAQFGDPFAPETGFVLGFPAGRFTPEGRWWPLHCPGAVALARGNDPDSGSSEFYIVNGQAPRHLDRNMAVFGRVVYGMQVILKASRGQPPARGVIEDESQRTVINRVILAADLPEDKRTPIQIQRTDTLNFIGGLDDRRERRNAFFFRRPAQFLDICTVPVPAQLVDE